MKNLIFFHEPSELKLASPIFRPILLVFEHKNYIRNWNELVASAKFHEDRINCTQVIIGKICKHTTQNANLFPYVKNSLRSVNYLSCRVSVLSVIFDSYESLEYF